MAITQAMCTSFKKALLDGEMDFSSDTSQVFKIALYDSNASLDAATTAYSSLRLERTLQVQQPLTVSI